ncbi:MAG: hypothetical protein AAGA60_17300 [Cyanobacteria bacterium P01_E01_bin.42]
MRNFPSGFLDAETQWMFVPYIFVCWRSRTIRSILVNNTLVL